MEGERTERTVIAKKVLGLSHIVAEGLFRSPQHMASHETDDVGSQLYKL